MKYLHLLAALLLPVTTTGRAILGIDLGSLYMKVALVQSGAPLEIVTNLHSKRKTEQMILFERQQRFYGADANALLARKSPLTPVGMSVMLGKDDLHPTVQTFAERHFPVQPTYNESRHGASLAVGKDNFTPEELVAMVLNHAIEISVAHATENGKPIPPPKDVVLTVPAFSTGLERQALVDAASIIDLNVLTLMEENTAAALHYAMDKSFEEEDVVLVFFNLGAASLQVSVVRFFQYEQPQKFGKSKSTPALQVLGKAWDATLGGQAFDQVLVDILADEFNASWRKASGDATKDIRAFTRPMTKLRLQANKVKHVLSANSEIPVNMDALHDDISLRTVITRSQFEEASAALLERSVLPFQKALAVANMTAADLTGVELIGGGMRIPAIQNRLQEALGDSLTVGLHMNADESMALGASFGGANISTAFRVRQVGLADISPWEETVTLTNLGEDTSSDEAWTKQATIFKSFGKLNVKKTIAFTHEQDVHCSLDYAESEWLPEGTQRELQRYQVSGVADFAKEMAEKGLEGKPKISLQFELDSSGITSLVKAEAALEETYMVEEEVEVDDEEDADAASSEEVKTEEKIEEKVEEAADSEKTEDGTEAEEPPKVEKKKVKVETEKKRVHKKTLKVEEYFVGKVQPYSAELLEASKAKLAEMARKDEERVLLEESKNKVESYIYMIKNKVIDDEETLSKVSTKKQREACRKAAVDAEDWLYDDGSAAGLATMEDKYAALSAPFEKILLRVREMTHRPEKAAKLKKKLSEVEDLMTKWESTMPQVTEEERAEVMGKVEAARKWLSDKLDQQESTKSHEEPAFLSTEIAPQFKPVESLVLRLSKKPKPKPEKKEEEADSNSTETNSTTSSADGDSSSETDGSDPTDASKEGEETETDDEEL